LVDEGKLELDARLVDVLRDLKPLPGKRIVDPRSGTSLSITCCITPGLSRPLPERFGNWNSVWRRSTAGPAKEFGEICCFKAAHRAHVCIPAAIMTEQVNQPREGEQAEPVGCELPPHDIITDLAFSPNGKHLAAAQNHLDQRATASHQDDHNDQGLSHRRQLARRGKSLTRAVQARQ
jgi:hypothetical protein